MFDVLVIEELTYKRDSWRNIYRRQRKKYIREILKSRLLDADYEGERKKGER